MSLDKVVKVLNKLAIGRVEKETSSEDSDAKSDGEFFCMEDTFLSTDIKVSVNDVGAINFPIEENIIKKLIGLSEKAKFGKGTETILDTKVRDTQTIPASKLDVRINDEALKNVLNRVEAELNIDENSNLHLHLYNMLIYGKGQFFKKHRDSEKVPNQVATLVIVLPYAHTGGDLIIYHQGSKHKFFASSNPKIIKCITFYSDCYHEVEEVKDGYRIALTYNVELKSGPAPEGGAVNENLRKAISAYFDEKDADKLVYYLDHQYTEQSLKWHLLKGADQTRAKALLAVAKKEGYVPCLALATYHEVTDEEYEDFVESDTELNFWVNEHNQRFDIGNIEVSEDEICFTKDTKDSFEPYEREETGFTGNEGAPVEEWYHRSCVVLWYSTWSFLEGFRTELAALHSLTTQTDMEMTLLEKLKENEENFSNYEFWKDDIVKKMLLDIVVYLSDMEMNKKILKKFKPSDVIDMGKNEMLVWISKTWNLELWEDLVKSWKSSNKSKLLPSLLPFLEQYMTKEDKKIEIAEYLLKETADLFINPEKEHYYSWGSSSSTSPSNDQNLCALLKICCKLGKLDLEKELMKNVKSASSAEEAAHFKMFEKELSSEQFARISGDLLSNMTNASLKKIVKDSYIYAEPKDCDIQNICSLLQNAIKVGNSTVEQQILGHIMSDRKTYTASFLADLFVKMQNVLGDRVNNYTQLKSHILSLIDEQLKKLSNPNDWSLPFKHPCSCQFCSQVQAFFVSSTSTQVIIPAAQRNRAHIYSYLNPLTYMPIKWETIRSGSPYKVTVTKLQKLQIDRQNLSKRLMICKKAIVEKADGESGSSAAKKAKV